MPIQVRNACHEIFKYLQSRIAPAISLVLRLVLVRRIFQLWDLDTIFFNQRHFSQVLYFLKSFIFRLINIEFFHEIFSNNLWAFDWAQLFFFGMQEGFFRTLIRCLHKCIVESLLNFIIDLYLNFVNAVIWSIWLRVYLIVILKSKQIPLFFCLLSQLIHLFHSFFLLLFHWDSVEFFCQRPLCIANMSLQIEPPVCLLLQVMLIHIILIVITLDICLEFFNTFLNRPPFFSFLLLLAPIYNISPLRPRFILLLLLDSHLIIGCHGVRFILKTGFPLIFESLFLRNFRLWLGDCWYAIEPLSNSICNLELILQFFVLIRAHKVIFVFYPSLRWLLRGGISWLICIFEMTCGCLPEAMHLTIFMDRLLLWLCQLVAASFVEQRCQSRVHLRSFFFRFSFPVHISEGWKILMIWTLRLWGFVGWACPASSVLTYAAIKIVLLDEKTWLSCHQQVLLWEAALLFYCNCIKYLSFCILHVILKYFLVFAGSSRLIQSVTRVVNSSLILTIFPALKERFSATQIIVTLMFCPLHRHLTSLTTRQIVILSI